MHVAGAISFLDANRGIVLQLHNPCSLPLLLGLIGNARRLTCLLQLLLNTFLFRLSSEMLNTSRGRSTDGPNVIVKAVDKVSLRTGMLLW